MGSYPALGWFEPNIRYYMVCVAQLGERQVVILEVMGSKPITYPKCLCGEIGKHNGFKLRALRVRLPPEIPKCLGDGIGIHVSLRN